MLNLPAGADARAGRATTQVAVGLEPGVGALEALPVVLVGGGEPGRQVRELELLLVDLPAAADQLSGERLAGSRRNSPDPSIHTRIVRTSVWRIKKRMLISGAANPNPPAQLLAGSEQRRRHRQVRPVGPAGGGL